MTLRVPVSYWSGALQKAARFGSADVSHDYPGLGSFGEEDGEVKCHSHHIASRA